MNTKFIYLAGGCFWGVQEYFNRIRGVISTVAGYANGDIQNPSYEQVCKQDTGFAECVKISYDADIIALSKLLDYFFRIIDPKSVNRQGNDVGPQYRSGIYPDNQEDFKIASEFINIKTLEFGPLAIELKIIKNFFNAEDYHQNYLQKNPKGYCSVDLSIANISHKRQFTKPGTEKIKEMLTPTEFEITQNSHTEPPFSSPNNNLFERGIYVDIVTGEPLFSSKDKFNSSCGWPAFAKPIENGILTYKDDYSMGTSRIEVKSFVANSHLGHVFNDGPLDSGGLRYCINGVALRFIPYNQMEELGYKDWLDSV